MNCPYAHSQNGESECHHQGFYGAHSELYLECLIQAETFTTLRSHRLRALICMNQLQLISWFGLRPSDCPSGKLQNRMGQETHRKAPGNDGCANLSDSFLTIQVNDVDRKIHAAGVNGLTGTNPQPLARIESSPP